MPLRDSIRLAVGTLTVLPTGPVRVDRSVARGAMLLAPLAVVPLALAAGLTDHLAALAGWPPLVCGLLTVAVLALGTRALHLDGLADTVDGLGTGWDRARALEVMRRGDVGPMGVTALVLVLALQAEAMAGLAGSWRSAATLAVVVCCSRAVLSLACSEGIPAARPDGLGAAVAGTVPRPLAALSWLLVAAASVLLAVGQERVWWLGLVPVLVAVLAAALLLRHCVRRFGGISGDVLGAAVEVTLTVLLLGAVL